MVRDLVTGDLDQILELEAATFRMPWSREVFEAELAAPGRSYVVADHEGRVVGFGGLMLVERDAHINTLARPAPGAGARGGEPVSCWRWCISGWREAPST